MIPLLALILYFLVGFWIAIYFERLAKKHNIEYPLEIKSTQAYVLVMIFWPIMLYLTFKELK